MIHSWKPILVIYACCLFIISPLMMARTYAVGRMETDETGWHSIVECRPAERRVTLRNQPANQKPGSELALGSWGGKHINLEVTAEGAFAEYDCGHGNVLRRISLDPRGRFKVTGTYVAERGGPVREGQQSDSVPVQFIGTVIGKRMYLTVKGRGSGKVIGNFTLVYGQEAALVKCR